MLTFFFLLFRFYPTDCIHKIGHCNFFLDTFNYSMGPTAVPMIRVPRVRTDLTTLSSKWVQEGDNTSLQVYIELMASNHFPVMQDVP